MCPRRVSMSSVAKVVFVIMEKTSLKGKDSLTFDKWIFRNGQPVRDDDQRRILEGSVRGVRPPKIRKAYTLYNVI